MQIADEWTLDGISMNLNKKVSTKFGSFRWKLRMKTTLSRALRKPIPFIKILRNDYITDCMSILAIVFGLIFTIKILFFEDEEEEGEIDEEIEAYFQKKYGTKNENK